jgi:hypothetical protein
VQCKQEREEKEKEEEEEQAFMSADITLLLSTCSSLSFLLFIFLIVK